MKKKTRLSKAEARILEQCWTLGTCSVREILESLPDDERVEVAPDDGRRRPHERLEMGREPSVVPARGSGHAAADITVGRSSTRARHAGEPLR